MIPRWAVKSIREQASWVGKRYYPHKEDWERAKEIEALRALAPDDPERTVEPVEDHPGRFETRQPTKGSGSISTWVSAGSLDEAKIKAKLALPFRPTWIPTEWKHREEGGKATPPNPTKVITIHLVRSPFYEGARFAVRNVAGKVLTTLGTWVDEPIGSLKASPFHKEWCFLDFMSAMEAAEKVRR